MPMSYLYGKRFIGPITPLVLELREELFLQPYNEINWKKVRHLCAKVSFDFLWKQFLFPMNMLRMHETHLKLFNIAGGSLLPPSPNTRSDVG